MRAPSPRGCVALIIVTVLVQPLAAAPLDPFLPDDTQAVASVNVHGLLESALFKRFFLDKLRTALAKNEELTTLLAQLEFDPYKDLKSVTAASPAMSGKSQGLLIVRGRFNLMKLHAAAEAVAQQTPGGFKIHIEDSIFVYELRDADKGFTLYAAFLDTEVLVVSTTRNYLSEAIAKNAGTKKPQLDKKFVALLKSVDEPRKTAWLAALATSDLKKDMARNELLKNIGPALRSVSGGLEFAESIDFDVLMHTGTAQAAGDLRKFVEGLKGILAFALGTNQELGQFGPALSDMLTALKVSMKRTDVIVQGKITSDLLEQGLKKAREKN